MHGVLDSAAREVRVFGLACGYRGQAPDTLPAKVILREGNERSLIVDSVHYSYSIPDTSTLHVRAFEKARGVAEGGLAPTSGPAPSRAW